MGRSLQGLQLTRNPKQMSEPKKQLDLSFKTKNFTLLELLQLDRNVGDEPNESIIKNLTWGITHVLQPARDLFGLPILSRVGWRGQKRNKRAGSTNQEHPNGQADDIDIPPLSNEEIMKRIFESDIPFFQLIDEQVYDSNGNLSSWVHISWRVLGANQKPSRILKTARNTKENLKINYTRI